MEILKESAKLLDKANDAVVGKGKRIQYFGKFRAYLFANFMVITLTCIVGAVVGIARGEFPVMMLMLVAAAASLLVCFFLWKSVAKKVPERERKMMFRIFFMSSIFVFGKVLLYFTIVLIPFLRIMGGKFEYGEFLVEDEWGVHKVYLYTNLMGEYVDAYGNIYV